MDFEVEIGNENAAGWGKDKLAAIRKHIQSETAKKTDKQRLEIEMLSIKYQMEDYLEAKEIEESEQKSVETFIKLYLGALNITFKSFAISIDTTDGNLKKYLSGERKLSTDLALKFAYFFHTPADLWLRVQMKNELHELEKEKDKLSHYKKYNYQRLVS